MYVETVHFVIFMHTRHVQICKNAYNHILIKWLLKREVCHHTSSDTRIIKIENNKSVQGTGKRYQGSPNRKLFSDLQFEGKDVFLTEWNWNIGFVNGDNENYEGIASFCYYLRWLEELRKTRYNQVIVLKWQVFFWQLHFRVAFFSLLSRIFVNS